MKQIILIAFALPTMALAEKFEWHEFYIQGLRSAPTEACEIFSELANDSEHLLQDLAIVRREQTCEQRSLETVQQILNQENRTWLAPMATEVAFEIAVEQSRHEEIIELALPLLQFKKSQKVREDILDQAISSAQEIQSDRLSRLQERLYEVAPRRHPNPSPDLYSAIAEDYKRNREFQRAADTFLMIFNRAGASWKTKLEALDGARRSLKEKFRTGQGDISEFFSSSKDYGDFALTNFLQRPQLGLEDQRKLALAYFQHGRDIWSYASTNQEQRDGIRNVLALFLQSPQVPAFLRAEALVLLTRVSQNYQEWDRGVRESQQALEILLARGQDPTGWNKWQRELFDKALWFNAHLIRKSGDIAQSFEKMKKVATDSTSEWARRRGRFWLGRGAKQLGNLEQSNIYYRELIADYPYHYYSLWAHYDGQIPLTPLPKVLNLLPERPQEVSSEDHDFIQALVLSAEQKLATEYLNRRLPQYSQELNHMLYRDFVGDHKSVVSTFFQMNSTNRRIIQDNYSAIIYPSPYEDFVAEQANRWDSLDKFYVYSIMRQESGYNPFSHSWADARGLLQLVPRVAVQEQERAGVSFQHVDELFLPEVNIPIGIAALDTRFQINYNNYILATASYNAGEQRVHRWMRNFFEGDVFEFQEDIPTEETRLYIRLVARNYINYMRLAASEPFLIPDWLFELSQIP